MQILTQRNKLVTKKDGSYFPLFNREDVSRDSFFQMRKELLQLGCPQAQIVPIAQELSIAVLGMRSRREYKKYIFEDTLRRCTEKIYNGCQYFPEQDPASAQYSHIELFSSIYNFEINYFNELAEPARLADLGCGEGTFVTLVRKILEKKIDGYDIKLCEYNSLPNMYQIDQLSDIPPIYTHLTLNHVLEHVLNHPRDFLSELLAHFHSGQTALKALIISLPIHSCLHSHQTAGHRWYFTEKPTESVFMIELEKYGLQRVSLLDDCTALFAEYGFSLHYISNLGIYFAEKRE